ncbi:MAG: hypothetical protein ACK57J_10145, partial [Rubrivivax sp.]
MSTAPDTDDLDQIRVWADSLPVATFRRLRSRFKARDFARWHRAGFPFYRTTFWYPLSQAPGHEVEEVIQRLRRRAESLTSERAQLARQSETQQSLVQGAQEAFTRDQSLAQQGFLTRDALLTRENALAEAKTRLSDTEQRVASLTEAGVRLFELVHASAEQAGDMLPQAIAKSDKA